MSTTEKSRSNASAKANERWKQCRVGRHDLAEELAHYFSELTTEKISMREAIDAALIVAHRLASKELLMFPDDVRPARKEREAYHGPTTYSVVRKPRKGAA